MDIIKHIYKLRRDFVLIGLTGKTGSGCTTVAEMLGKDIKDLRSECRDINSGDWNNVSRKNRIVYNYIREHWHPFETIKGSDVIFFIAMLEEWDVFSNSICRKDSDSASEDKDSDAAVDEEMKNAIETLKNKYCELHEQVKDYDEKLRNEYFDDAKNIKDFIVNVIPDFRKELSEALPTVKRRRMSKVLQRWGNNIRVNNSIKEPEDTEAKEVSPAFLAEKIDAFVCLFSYINENEENVPEDGPCSYIVIDALRNPYEVLYFREQYASFYLMSVNTEEIIRRDNLIKMGYNIDEIAEIDSEEERKHDLSQSYMKIDIARCIELSDIHLTHDGTPSDNNRGLVNQILTYISLIRHPGLVPPSSEERCMQMAYTAKLNSGCLSRQVGAVVTNEAFSIQAVGWNTAAEGQTPCSLRSLTDLSAMEDESAFSDFEKKNEKFGNAVKNLAGKYADNADFKKISLPCAYCFKDLYNAIQGVEKNPVHERSLHAEENAFLQLSKYGSAGIQGGKLFTTSSCCERCGKKAYQLGIKTIYYIDDYPGITNSHIIACGSKSPEMKLFNGAIGRAYVNLYDPFLPLKDEIEGLSGVIIKDYKLEENSDVKAKAEKE